MALALINDVDKACSLANIPHREANPWYRRKWNVRVGRFYGLDVREAMLGQEVSVIYVD